MKRSSVNSTNISSIGYDEKTQTLEIEFHNGGVYQYFDVPLHVFNDLMSAESCGRYFAQQVKGHYRYARV